MRHGLAAESAEAAQALAEARAPEANNVVRLEDARRGEGAVKRHDPA